MFRVLKYLLLAAVLVAIGARFYPPLRHLAWVAAGRAGVCPLPEAVSSWSHYRHQVELKDRILQTARQTEKDEAGFIRWDTTHGSFWVPKGSELQLPWLLAEQERRIYGSGEQGVRAGDVVLDGGANVGVFTREALTAGAKLVVAIEPAPENLECLRRNFRAEIEAGRVIVYPKGVWDREEALTLYINPRNSTVDSFVARPGTVEQPAIPLTTIDKLAAELKLEKIDFIKLDIEGAESKALAGAAAVLKQFKPRLAVSSYHSGEEAGEIPAVIRQARGDYQMTCGPCSEYNWSIRPDVLYFR